MCLIYSIRAECLDPDHIEAIFKVPATSKYRRGDAFVTDGATHQRGCGLWLFKTADFVSSTNANKHVEFALSTFEPHEKFIAELLLENTNVDIAANIRWTTNWLSTGIDLSPRLVQRLLLICNRISFGVSVNKDSDQISSRYEKVSGPLLKNCE